LLGAPNTKYPELEGSNTRVWLNELVNEVKDKRVAWKTISWMNRVGRQLFCAFSQNLV
jgi:beta-xylosidase